MTYKRFVRQLVKETGMLREDIHVALRIVFKGLKNALESGESVPIPMLGTFYPKFTKQRPWTSPSTGETKMLEGRVKLRFKASRRFEKQMNASIKEQIADVEED